MSTQIAGVTHDNSIRDSVRELGEKDRDRFLKLVATDPLHGVLLLGMIADREICDPAHRGRFYGHFEGDQLTAVALLGHHIVIFGDDSALPYFANKAAEIKAEGHMILGPRAQVEAFWNSLSQYGRKTRMLSDQHWYVCKTPRLPLKQLQLLRANAAELPVVADAHAQMAFDSSGKDPRVVDPQGFLHRVADRIAQKRVWVKIQDGKVVFKADLVCETPAAVYIEGVWTHPDYRNQGIGKSCLAELVHRLRREGRAVCLLTEPTELAAVRVYEKVGFVHMDNYQARFLHPVDAQN